SSARGSSAAGSSATGSSAGASSVTGSSDGASAGASSATGSLAGASSAAGVSSTVSSETASVSSAFFFLVFFSSAMALSRQACFTFDADGQDACDLALGVLQPRGVLEGARRRLEAQVEQLLARVGQAVLQLLVGQVAQLSSSQRDPPPSSRPWS